MIKLHKTGIIEGIAYILLGGFLVGFTLANTRIGKGEPTDYLEVILLWCLLGLPAFEIFVYGLAVSLIGLNKTSKKENIV